jgi:hypothetical protein
VQVFGRPTQPRPRRPTKRACCRVRAPAAADACSSSRPSRAAVSPSTDRHPCRRQSGSTPHDGVTADPPPKRHQPLAPDLDRHRPRSRRPVRLARIASAILVNKPPVRFGTDRDGEQFARRAMLTARVPLASRRPVRGGPPVRRRHRHLDRFPIAASVILAGPGRFRVAVECPVRAQCEKRRKWILAKSLISWCPGAESNPRLSN